MPNDDLVVELADDAKPPEAKPEAKIEIQQEARPEPLEPVEDLKQQLEALKAGQAAEKAAAEAARAEAARHAADAKEANERAQKANADLSESNVSAIDSAIAAARAQADGFEKEQQAAFEAGDFAKASKMGREMAKAEATIGRLEEGKANLEVRRTEAPKAERQPQRESVPADPFEAAISGTGDLTKRWLRDHREYVTDPLKSAEASVAHQKAIRAGFAVDTQGYLDYCEDALGLKEAPVEPRPARTERKASVMPGAPVSREGTPSGGQTSPTKVKLTAGEAQRATDGTLVHNFDDPNGKFKKGQVIGIQEMARRKLIMQAEGRYMSNSTDQ